MIDSMWTVMAEIEYIWAHWKFEYLTTEPPCRFGGAQPHSAGFVQALYIVAFAKVFLVSGFINYFKFCNMYEPNSDRLDINYMINCMNQSSAYI